MFDRQFIKSRLGKASLASVAAMAAFVALTAQMHATPAMAAQQSCAVVELA